MIKSFLKHKNIIPEFVIKLFPKDYENLDYLEPYGGSGIVLLNKLKSNLEVFNADGDLYNIFLALKDDPKYLISRLKRMKHCENTFTKMQKNKEDLDYIKSAISEFSLIGMSRNGAKKTYCGNRNQDDINSSWIKTVESLELIANRLDDVFIVNKPPLELISIFDREDAFCYIEAPEWDENDLGYHNKLFEVFQKHRAKILLNAPNVKFYKKSYKEWNSKVNKLSKRIVWMNY